LTPATCAETAVLSPASEAIGSEYATSARLVTPISLRNLPWVVATLVVCSGPQIENMFFDVIHSGPSALAPITGTLCAVR
jgi:hypothetical protein